MNNWYVYKHAWKSSYPRIAICYMTKSKYDYVLSHMSRIDVFAMDHPGKGKIRTFEGKLHPQGPDFVERFMYSSWLGESDYFVKATRADLRRLNEIKFKARVSKL